MRTNYNLRLTQSERINVLPGIGDLQYWFHCTFYVSVKKFVLSKCENKNMEVYKAHYGTIDSLMRNTIKHVNYLKGSTLETAKVYGLALDNVNDGHYLEHRRDILDFIVKIRKAPLREYKELSEQDIKVMALYYIKGWQIAEIGSFLKISYDQVRTCFLNFIYYFAYILNGAIFLDIDSTHNN